MKLRALHEAEWGWKQRGLAAPLSEPKPSSRWTPEEQEEMLAKKELKGRQAARGYYDPLAGSEAVAKELLAKQKAANAARHARIQAARRHAAKPGKPLIRFPEN